MKQSFETMKPLSGRYVSHPMEGYILCGYFPIVRRNLTDNPLSDESPFGVIFTGEAIGFCNCCKVET